MKNVHITVNGLGALPLEDVKGGRGRKDNACVEHVHLGKSLVAFAYKLAFDVLELGFECGIVRRCRHVNGFLAALFEFFADRSECRPVSLVV